MNPWAFFRRFKVAEEQTIIDSILDIKIEENSSGAIRGQQERIEQNIIWGKPPNRKLL
jgi:hypothetical protein